MPHRFLSAILCATALILGGQAARADEPKKPLIVFAAASLTDVLKAEATAWARETGKPMPRLSFGASATMARQVAAGAPADLMLSANPAWVQMLEKGGFLSGAPVPLVKNSLVLVVPSRGAAGTPGHLVTRELIEKTVGGGKLALADPAIAPAGAYARAFLEHIGLWLPLKPRLALAPNVRQALLLVERGGLPGFVYGSDAAASKRVIILGTVPEGSTKPILYMAGMTKAAQADANAFLTYLTSPASGPVWRRFGFTPIVSN
ncbi:molybdate ABC transporter substrate-binding protein [Kordiimonas marina]|uniref:molybdate ABC transporter substrate-binding protein n=1 Tax=Kordiimonas marina TaxID=2872312 RepID=UPI001FF56551|nr:molybdate ABC transporter substrate-binding protein [Kordiimonas marina]MCJ9429448.1 molybdate ABC transporter substrate-binding protein [Kordiimonas marina]